jgi:hypothetical protein
MGIVMRLKLAQTTSIPGLNMMAGVKIAIAGFDENLK